MLTILDHFKAVSERNQLAHAYIIDNISDAWDLFKQLASLLQILEQDTYYITPNSNAINVDQIRDITHRLSKSPIGKLHLVGIYPADKLNTQACNALLKCLEEPSSNTCFVLLTQNAQLLLPTIRSRTQILRASSQSLEQYKSHPQYQTILNIYQFNPTSIDEELLGLKLLEISKSKDPYTEIHKLDVKPSLLLQLSLQIIANKLLKSSDIALWTTYDKLMELNKDYQKLYNLNDKAILDRIGLAMQSRSN